MCFLLWNIKKLWLVRGIERFSGCLSSVNLHVRITWSDWNAGKGFIWDSKPWYTSNGLFIECQCCSQRLFVWHHESGLLAKSAIQSTHLSCTVVSLCMHDLKPLLNLDRFCCRVLSSAEHLFITDRTHLGSGLGIVYCMGRDVNNHCNDGQKTLADWLVICDRSDILWKRTKFWLLQLFQPCYAHGKQLWLKPKCHVPCTLPCTLQHSLVFSKFDALHCDIVRRKYFKSFPDNNVFFASFFAVLFKVFIIILFIPIQSAGIVDYSSSVLSQSIRQMTACSQELLTLIR